MSKTAPSKSICITAVCIALCSIMPLVFHSIGLGTALSPMHIPVLLCGTLCGGIFGTVCGLTGPILSSILTGMPGPAMLTGMIPELAVYGLATGLLMRFVRTGRTAADVYISLCAAMVAGRIIGGIAKALFFTGGEGYSLALWASGYFVSTAPGIVCHLIVVPLLVGVLMRPQLIPARYPKRS